MPHDYSIHVLEYGQTVDQAIGVALYGAHNEGIKAMPYGFIALESEQDLILVDVGFEASDSGLMMQKKFRVDPYITPAAALASIGRTPQDVTHVIITHAHYDHMGALSSFPNAHFYLQRNELKTWRWALGLGSRFDQITAACNPDDVAQAESLIEQGRMTLLDGAMQELLPGISIEVAENAHSYALQYPVIDTISAGRYIGASDVAFSRLNLTGYNNDGVMIPLGFGVGSPTNMLLALDKVWSLVQGEIERVLIVHEPETYAGPGAWTSSTGMRVAEIALRPGDMTRRPTR
jgi:N-acyl homoserine lactone hydrolase